MVDQKKPDDKEIADEKKKAAGKSAVINTPGGSADSGAELLSVEEIQGMVGDLEPGDIGYIPLDEEGKPTGAAISVMPTDGTLVAPVLAQAPVVYDELSTPAGAPITTMMNPIHSFYDPGLHDRLISYGGGGVSEPLAKPGVKQSGVYENTNKNIPPAPAKTPTTHPV